MVMKDDLMYRSNCQIIALRFTQYESCQAWIAPHLCNDDSEAIPYGYTKHPLLEQHSLLTFGNLKV
jgi:hypothetical protein